MTREPTDELETALRRTLADAAEHAPQAPPGIGLEPRRVRRGYSKVALTAAAVAVAIGGATVGGHVLTSGRPAAHATASPSPALHRPKNAKAPPIESVWPGAVHRIPEALPNGRYFHPEALIDAHTLLISTESAADGTDTLWAYDLRDHGTRQITTAPKTTLNAPDYATGGGYVAWWADDGKATRIWSARLSGGPPRLVARLPAQELSRLTIDGADAVWSLARTGGVYRAPLAGGGTARMVPGSAGMGILAWPWIGTPATTEGLGKDGMGAGYTAFAWLKNAVTGETRSASLTDRAAAWQCGVTWCVGQGPNFITQAQRRDGSGRRAIPEQGGSRPVPPLLDRFVIAFTKGKAVSVYDLRTGKIGDLRADRGKQETFILPRDPGSPLYWTVTKGGFIIVDLAAI